MVYLRSKLLILLPPKERCSKHGRELLLLMVVDVVNVLLNIAGIDVVEFFLADARCTITVVALNEHATRELVAVEGIELVPAPTIVAIEEIHSHVLVKITVT